MTYCACCKAARLGAFVVVVTMWAGIASASDRAPKQDGSGRRAAAVATTLDTVYWLPDLEVTALRERRARDSISAGVLSVSKTYHARELTSDRQGQKPPVYRRWWVWGAVGAGVAVLVYGFSSHRDPPKGTLRVAVGGTP